MKSLLNRNELEDLKQNFPYGYHGEGMYYSLQHGRSGKQHVDLIRADTASDHPSSCDIYYCSRDSCDVTYCHPSSCDVSDCNYSSCDASYCNSDVCSPSSCKNEC
jgi:hypothetical protein